MQSWLFYLWALNGGGIATAVMIIIWLPRPLPYMQYAGVLIAGILGGIAGGFLTHVAGSDPMPGIVASFTGGLILSGGAALFSSRGRTP